MAAGALARTQEDASGRERDESGAAAADPQVEAETSRGPTRTAKHPGMHAAQVMPGAERGAVAEIVATSSRTEHDVMVV